MKTFMGRARSMRRFSRVAILEFHLGIFVFAFCGAPSNASDLPTTRLRIRISERGIYELVPADLAAAGVPVGDAGVDPRTLRLLFDSWKPVSLFADSTPASWQRDYEMDEVAIWVPGEEDGRLDPQDRIVFYALGPDGWDDLAGVPADSLAFSRYPYDRFDYGWVVWGSSPGLRMETGSAAAPTTDLAVTRVGHREHREEDRYFVDLGDLWAWQRVHPVNPTSVEFGLDLGNDATATGTLYLQLGNIDGQSEATEIQLNGVVLGTVASSWDRVTRYTFDMAPLQSQNTLVLRPIGHSSTGLLMLFELDVTWNRPLVADARGELAWSTAIDADPEIYELRGFDFDEPLLLDVTDPQRPVRLTDLTFLEDPARWRVRCGRTGTRAHCLAVTTPRRLDPQRDIEMRAVAALRSRTSSPDMLIVTHPDLLPAAERLAEHRRKHFPDIRNPDILVTTTREIYDNFSGGRQDPLAIRNWVKYLYGLSTPSRLAYLLLLGDATRDPRQVLRESPPTLVPTVHAPYADARIKRAYAVDDWFGAMHSPSGGWFSPKADLSIGRLPARTLAEADLMVDKILGYENGAMNGPWRGRVLIAADDECHTSSGCFETYFVAGAEGLTAKVPEALDLRKIYMTEYALDNYQKPDARAAFIRSWNEGCVLLNYDGHGGSGQLSDEVLFLASDIPSLTNITKLPLFVTIGCNVSEFDIPGRQSLCEQLLAAPNGGAIATIGATWTPYVGPAHDIALRQFTELFREGATTQQPIGVVHRVSKGMALPTNEHFVLLGDPALVLKLPRALVTFTSGADQLIAGRRSRIEGIVHMPGSSQGLVDFEGEAEIEVLGNSDESGYQRTDPPLTIPYVLPGEPIYRGQVEVHAGRFAFEFTVPPLPGPEATGAKGLLFGSGARVSAYAWSADLDAKGGRDRILLTGDGGQDASQAAPRIRLAFPGGATRVAPGSELTAEFEDENGIWIAGITPASSIQLRCDDGEPHDITAAYRSTGGSDISGSVCMPLPDLSLGPHRATVSASDKLGNPTSASLDFEVIETANLRLTDFSAAPNPTRAGADFAFLLDVPAEVELRIFSVDGREVFHTRQQHDGLRRGLVQWNGVATTGRLVSSGVYLFKLSAHPAGAPMQRLTGKLVVLR